MSSIRRRCVFYVSGFDPKGARYYHGLYKEQAALQAKVNGMHVEVGPRRALHEGGAFWELRADTAEGPVDTRYEFMAWDDVVRDHWPKSQLRLWWKIVVTTIFYLRTGTLWKMFKLAWPIAVAAFVPFVLVCCVFIGVPIAMWLTGWLVSALTGEPRFAWLFAGLAGVALLWIAHRLEARYSLYWMMRSYAFTARQGRGELPELEARLDALANRLVQRVDAAGCDEVLVVGHSSGAIMAVAILARALRQAPRLAAGSTPRLSLLTLGQCIPLLALLPGAHGLRRELELLGAAGNLDWIDFSAPPDGCCFALVDPLGGCGLTAASDRPKLLSPRFADMFSPAEYQQLRSDKLRMHFQYLRASAYPQAYDYFLITAGALSLADRFASIPGVVGYSGLRPFGPPADPARTPSRIRSG